MIFKTISHYEKYLNDKRPNTNIQRVLWKIETESFAVLIIENDEDTYQAFKFFDFDMQHIDIFLEFKNYREKDILKSVLGDIFLHNLMNDVQNSILQISQKGNLILQENTFAADNILFEEQFKK